jgi:Tfp pilus assembly protein PilV
MKNRDGFTLISVIIAVTLLSVGILALANSMYHVVRVTRIENQRTHALQIATLYMEEVRSRNPWTLASEGPTMVDSLGTANASGTFTRQMTVTSENAQLVRVVLTVTPRGTTRHIRLTTLIFKVLT